MGRTSYFILLIWMIISFVALLRYISRFGYTSFLKEFFVILVLIAVALVSLFMVGFRKNAGWVVAAVFFAIIILNMAYLFFKSSSCWIFLNALIAAIGFVFSTAMIGRHREEITEFPEPEERVKELEREGEALQEAEKKVAVAKKPKRKTPRKRAAKKKTKRKR